MRLHFAKLDLSSDHSDKLIILDKDGNELLDYTALKEPREDFWTEWYAGNTLKVILITGETNTAYGFKIDQIETRMDMAPDSSLPESYHPYANNFVYTWPAISVSRATQMRLHFAKLDLSSDPSDKLIILDENGKKLNIYTGLTGSLEDFWTDWYAGNTLKVKLETDGATIGYGFKIDQIETRIDSTMAIPTASPTAIPTAIPTTSPTAIPTASPIECPTESSTQSPTGYYIIAIIGTIATIIAAIVGSLLGKK